MWLFTGIDPIDRDTIGAAAEGTAHLGGGDANTLLFAGRAWARGAGWQLELEAALQPVGSLRDRFWRSGRGVDQADVLVEIPDMWALGNDDWQLIAGHTRVAFGARTGTAFDHDFELDGFRLQTRSTTVDVFDFDLFELGAARQTIGQVTYGDAISGFDVQLELVARGSRRPARRGIARRASPRIHARRRLVAARRSDGPRGRFRRARLARDRSGAALRPRARGPRARALAPRRARRWRAGNAAAARHRDVDGPRLARYLRSRVARAVPRRLDVGRALRSRRPSLEHACDRRGRDARRRRPHRELALPEVVSPR